MKIDTTRFGPIEIEAGDVIHFPEGLLGLPSSRDWVLLADAENDALGWLQSADRAEIALGVVSPRRFVPAYRMRVARRELEPLELEDVQSAAVLVVVSKTGRSMTLNLKAPLVINLGRRLGRQVVTNGDLPVQYVLGSASPALRRIAYAPPRDWMRPFPQRQVDPTYPDQVATPRGTEGINTAGSIHDPAWPAPADLGPRSPEGGGQ